jgi:hypothetical protein
VEPAPDIITLNTLPSLFSLPFFPSPHPFYPSPSLPFHSIPLFSQPFPSTAFAMALDVPPPSLTADIEGEESEEKAEDNSADLPAGMCF